MSHNGSQSEDEEVYMDSGGVDQSSGEQNEEDTEETQESSEDEYVPKSLQKKSKPSMIKGRASSDGGAKEKSSASGFTCDICSKVLSNKRRLIYHKYTHSGKGPLTCPLCPSVLRNPESLRSHVYNQHKYPERRQSHNRNKKILESSKMKRKKLPTKIIKRIRQGTTATVTSEPTEESADTKASDNVGKSCKQKYTCKICSSSYKHEYNLKRHMREHENKGAFTCSICRIRFTSIHGLKVHMAHKKHNTFKCKTCGDAFTDGDLFAQHMAEHMTNSSPKINEKSPSKVMVLPKEAKPTSETPKDPTKAVGHLMPCKQCSKVFSTLPNLLLHKKCHAPRGPLACAFCETMFKNIPSLKAHIYRKHKEKIVKVRKIRKGSPSPESETSSNEDHDESLKTSPGKFSCNECPREFTLFSNFLSHKEAHKRHLKRSRGPHSCPYCNKVYLNWASLNSHIYRHKKTLELEGTKGETSSGTEDSFNMKCFQCDQCLKICNTQFNLKLHKEAHARKIPGRMSCPICHKVYKNERGMYRHRKRTHEESETMLNGENTFACPYCDKVLKDGPTFRAHIQDHQQELKIRISLTTKSVKLSASSHPLKLKAKIKQNEAKSRITQDMQLSPKEEEGESKPYRCHRCSAAYTNILSLKKHLKSHRKKGILQCSKCGLRFNTDRAMKMHNWWKHKNQQQLVKKVPEETSKMELSPKVPKINLSRLEEAATPNQTFNCPQCSASFINKHRLAAHVILHKKKGIMECKFCGIRFNTYKAMTIHKWRLHRDQMPKKPEEDDQKLTPTVQLSPKIPRISLPKLEHATEDAGESSIDNLFRCPRCPSSFCNQSKLSWHLKMHRKKGVIPCPTCGLRFNTEKAMKIHASSHKFIRCHICTQRLKDGMEMKQHLQEIHKIFSSQKEIPEPVRPGIIHSGVGIKNRITKPSCKKLTCNQCFKVFSSSESLSVHKKIHAEKNPVACPICGNFYKNTPSLAKHVLRHKELARTNPKYIPKWNPRFKKPEDVEENKNVSEAPEEAYRSSSSSAEEKPLDKRFNCNHCSFSCDYRSTFLNHLKSHTRKGSLSCNTCGLRFKTLKALKVHMWRHTALRCHICKLQIGSDARLEQHMEKCHKTETNTGASSANERPLTPNSPNLNEIPFACTFCNEKFNGEDNFERHMRKKHNIEPDVAETFSPPVRYSEAAPKKMDPPQEVPKKPPTPTIFQCDICADKFTDKDTRTRHIKEIHFGIKPS